MNGILVVGEQPAADRVAETIASARAWAPAPAGDPDGSSAALARAMVELEAELERVPTDELLLADDSDAALAGALVALKMAVAVRAIDGACAGKGANARVIAQLAETRSMQP